MQQTREDIQRRLTALKATDPHLRRFGAAKHAYKLHPPLTEQEVVAVEQRLRIKLPKEYREFILRIADGGAGPDYGLFRLADIEAELWTGAGKQRKLLYDPGRPFARPCSVDEARRLGGYPTHGVLPLAESGCGGAYLLICAGVERGTIWTFGNEDSYLPLFPESPSYPTQSTIQERLQINAAFANGLLSPANTIRLNFLDWYERWLRGE